MIDSAVDQDQGQEQSERAMAEEPKTTTTTMTTATNGSAESSSSHASDVESLSDRGKGLLKPMPEYLCMLMNGLNNLWDADRNPEGYVMLCVAENKLSVPMLDNKVR